MSNPLVSLIIPVYNKYEYLDECLKSVEAQSYQNLDVIIINDGSTDKSMEKIKEYQAKNPSWRVYSQKNRGLGYTRNYGLILSLGEYITYLDSDDSVHPDMYQRLVAKARAESADVVLTNFRKYKDTDGSFVTNRRDNYNKAINMSKDQRYRAIFSGTIYSVVSCSLIKKELFSTYSLMFPLDVFHEDIYVMPQIYFYANKIAHCKEENYYWRERGDSLGHSCSVKHITSIYNAIREHDFFLKERGIYNLVKKEYTKFCLAYIHTLFNKIQNVEDKELKVYMLDYLFSVFQEVSKDKMEFVEEYKEPFKQSLSYFLSRNNRSKPIANIARVKLYKGCDIDFVFMPHKKYHSTTMLPIAQKLRLKGYSVIFIDMSTAYADEGAMEPLSQSNEFVLKYEEFQGFHFNYGVVIVMNDWDTKCTMPTVIQANNLGVKTVGIVEGIQDFWDKDTGRFRHPYQNVKHLMMTGVHDRKYFSDTHHVSKKVIGFPRLIPLLQNQRVEPKQKNILINCNFTYGVLDKAKDKWLKEAVQAINNLKLSYSITQHPQDTYEYKGYKKTDLNMYDALSESSLLISRFSSAIIEAISMGVPAVYYNPNIEAVDKFTEPMGAFSIAKDTKSLIEAIKYELQNSSNVRQRSKRYLEHHCNLSLLEYSVDIAADYLEELLVDSRNNMINTVDDNIPYNLDNKSDLIIANQLFQNGDYRKAKDMYIALASSGGVYKNMKINIALCEKRIANIF